MARSSALLLFFFIVCALLDINKMSTVTSTDGSLFLTALSKGTIPPFSPSNKVQSTFTDEKLAALHLATIDRILRSVPSPGVGH
ncbi:hypothetical protein NMG60_11015012 [Bertholletia excelsa]